MYFPSVTRERCGFILFRWNDSIGWVHSLRRQCLLPMTADARAAVLTARRAAQHFRLSVPHDAYEYLCILTILPEPRPVSALCWQIHRCLAVSVPLLRVWVHCPRASNGPLPRRSYLVGYAQWDARFNQCLLVKQSVPAAFQVAACDGTQGLINSLPPDNHFQQLYRSHSCNATSTGCWPGASNSRNVDNSGYNSFGGGR